MIHWRFWIVFSALSFAPLIISIVKFTHGDPILFQRSGGLVVVGAVLSLALIRQKSLEFEAAYHEQAKRGVAMNLTGRWAIQVVLASTFTFWFEIILIVVGTLISSYGDMLL